jgi:nucleoside-diphosphate-sugar epimerase
VRDELSDLKILITGPTGQVARAIAGSLARANEVWGIARFSSPEAREKLEAAGVRCVAVDLVEGDLSEVPNDFDYVLNFAVMKTGDFDRDLAGNAESVGLLMQHCSRSRAFLHCSSTAVYQPHDHEPLRETDPLGDGHRAFGFLPTYSLCKIAAEAVARAGARQWQLPTTIARLSVPYGDEGGWPAMHLEMMIRGHDVPVHENAPSVFNPIHEDDLVAQIPKLLAVADVPATIVNWAGRDAVSIEAWCAYLGKLTGLEPKFAPTTATIESVVADTTRMRELIGNTTVPWREGMRRMVEARHPELLPTR